MRRGASDKPDGERYSIAEVMMKNMCRKRTPSIQVLKPIIPKVLFEEQRQWNIFHSLPYACPETAELLLRAIIAVNQVSIYGAGENDVTTNVCQRLSSLKTRRH